MADKRGRKTTKMHTDKNDTSIDLWQKASDVKRAGQVAHFCRVHGIKKPSSQSYRDREVELLHKHNPDLPVCHIERQIDSGYACKDGLYYFERLPVIS